MNIQYVYKNGTSPKTHDMILKSTESCNCVDTTPTLYLGGPDFRP